MTEARLDPGLVRYDGRRIAVLWHLGQDWRVFRGTARYVGGSDGGNALWIGFDDLGREDGNPVLILDETHWDGQITVDHEFGCDYQTEVRMCPGRGGGPHRQPQAPEGPI